MPVPKNKPTTSDSSDSTPESTSNVLPEQEDFRQHLRRLAVSAVQVLVEQVMREELEQCIGASWGECTPTRRGYRNGHYTRDLVTSRGSAHQSFGEHAPNIASAILRPFAVCVRTKSIYSRFMRFHR
ncbi:MAG TPA: transposase [Ktedonobacteraceae bacterium]|nr:transposase [Ktedonobacteraceae bacterium]